MRSDTRTNYTSAVGLFLQGSGSISQGYEAGNGRLVFPTRFDWDVVHTGGVSRIKEATIYARTQVAIEYMRSGSWTNAYGTCIAKVGTATEVSTPQGGKVCFEANLDGAAIAKAGAAAVGAPVYSTWTAYGEADGSYEVEFFLVYELQPWASLPGW